MPELSPVTTDKDHLLLVSLPGVSGLWRLKFKLQSEVVLYNFSVVIIIIFFLEH